MNKFLVSKLVSNLVNIVTNYFLFINLVISDINFHCYLPFN